MRSGGFLCCISNFLGKQTPDSKFFLLSWFLYFSQTCFSTTTAFSCNSIFLLFWFMFLAEIWCSSFSLFFVAALPCSTVRHSLFPFPSSSTNLLFYVPLPPQFFDLSPTLFEPLCRSCSILLRLLYTPSLPGAILVCLPGHGRLSCQFFFLSY